MSDAVRAIQYALRASGVKVAADGVFGPRTFEAIENSKSRSVQALAAEYPSLARRPQSGSRIFFSTEEVARAIDKAVAAIGESVRPFLELMARLENFTVTGGFETSSTGTFRGLGQFSATTWEDVRKRGGVPLPSYADGTKSAEASMLAAAVYWRLHRAQFLRLASSRGWKQEFSPGIAYLYHQQGAGGAEHFLSTGSLLFPKQSAASIRVMLDGRNRVV